MTRLRIVATIAAVVVVAIPHPGTSIALGQVAEDIAEFAYAPTEGPSGTAISATGRCVFRTGQPGDTAIVNLVQDQGPVIASITMTPSAADGTFAGSLSVPPDALPGPHHLTGQCSLTDFAFGTPPNVAFTVTGAAPTTSTLAVTTTSVLARTGAPSQSRPIAIAVLLSAVGLALVIVARRRRPV